MYITQYGQRFYLIAFILNSCHRFHVTFFRLFIALTINNPKIFRKIVSEQMGDPDHTEKTLVEISLSSAPSDKILIGEVYLILLHYICFPFQLFRSEFCRKCRRQGKF